MKFTSIRSGVILIFAAFTSNYIDHS